MAPPASNCTHCGQDHDAILRICPKTGKAIGTPQAALGKTLFGIPSAAMSALPVPQVAAGKVAPINPGAVPPTPSVQSGNRTDALALGKTFFGNAPLPGPPRAAAPRPSTVATSPALTAPVARLPNGISQAHKLPSEEEARQNPDLVVSLEKSSAPTNHAAVKSENSLFDNRPLPALELDRGTAPVDLPSIDLPARPGSGVRAASPGEPPTDPPIDLPNAGKSRRFVLPQPKSAAKSAAQNTAASAATGRQRTERFSDRLAADTKSIIELLDWAITLYLRKPTILLMLAAFLVLPASVVQSCLVASITGTSAASAVAPGAATVDFSARKADLAGRIQASQARGQIDRQAAAELAALTTVETAYVPTPSGVAREGVGWLRERLASLVQALLLFGLAFPIACGALAVATVDHQGGASMPGLADVWPILVNRRELFLVSLIPAALLVAVGHALFVLPGLVLSVLFLFVPQVVLFEKKGGRLALLRSIALVKSDAIRIVLAFLSFALAGFAAATLAELLIPPFGGRAVVFIHCVIGDLLGVTVLPIPALVLARIYSDLRGRQGVTPEQLSRAARG